MDIIPIIFAVVVVILTIVLAVVGVTLVLVLLEVRRTLKKANQAIDVIEDKVNAVIGPLQNLGGMAAGLSTGFKVFEAFVGWLQRDKDKDDK